MAVSHAAPTCTSSTRLQSLLLPSFKLRNPLVFSHSIASSSLNSKRLHFHGLHVRASANASASAAAGDSGNGAVLAPDKNSDVTPYGRQFFPLAAVVGQVIAFTLIFPGETIAFAFQFCIFLSKCEMGFAVLCLWRSGS